MQQVLLFWIFTLNLSGKCIFTIFIEAIFYFYFKSNLNLRNIITQLIKADQLRNKFLNKKITYLAL
jgi:hypothetical protein